MLFVLPSSLRSTADQLGLREFLKPPPPAPPAPPPGPLPPLTPSILGSCRPGPRKAITTIWATLKEVLSESSAPPVFLSGRPKSRMMGSIRSILAFMEEECALLRDMERMAKDRRGS